MGGAGIIAANNASHSSNPPVDDIVIQRSVGGTEQATQQVVNGLMAESSNEVMPLLWNADIFTSLGEVFNGGFDYLSG